MRLQSEKNSDGDGARMPIALDPISYAFLLFIAHLRGREPFTARR